MNRNAPTRFRRCFFALSIAAASLTAALLPETSIAADRALLVGVGAYRNLPQQNLDGNDLDIEMMKKAAVLLGFEPGQTKVLLDADATQQAVEAGLSQWLRDGVTADDRVLIYVSSHGTQVPDESGDEGDGVDEALTLHDLDVVERDGKPTLTGVLLDDTFDRALMANPSRNILVIVDACHSGTATKGLRFRSLQSGAAQGQVKYFHYAGKPVGELRGLARKSADADNYVAISAAADNEESIATPRGSLFTLGVAKAIGDAGSALDALTPRMIREQSAAFVTELLGGPDAERIFHPQLSGNSALADKPVAMAAVADGGGPTWRKLEAMVAGMKPLSMRTNQQQFREGELLQLTIDVPYQGYLNVINIDARDTAIVAFPNRFSPDNKIGPGTVTIPGDLPFDLPAGPPHGPTLLVAFVTEKPISLFNSGDGKRDVTGAMLDYFPQVSELGLRGFRPTAKTGQEAVGANLEVRICPAAGCN